VLEAQPLDGIAGIDVDDLQPAAGDRVLGGEPFVEREAFEGAVAARPRRIRRLVLSLIEWPHQSTRDLPYTAPALSDELLLVFTSAIN
jgi:hypothetical protein